MTPDDRDPPTRPQQQPAREGDPQQPPQAGGQQMGEGSYEATRDYQEDIQDYLKKGTVEADARAAKPRSEAEAKDLEQAEREGKSHSRGER